MAYHYGNSQYGAPTPDGLNPSRGYGDPTGGLAALPIKVTTFTLQAKPLQLSMVGARPLIQSFAFSAKPLLLSTFLTAKTPGITFVLFASSVQISSINANSARLSLFADAKPITVLYYFAARIPEQTFDLSASSLSLVSYFISDSLGRAAFLNAPSLELQEAISSKPLEFSGTLSGIDLYWDISDKN